MKRVETILREKNVPYELIPITLGQTNNTPEYFQKQPFGQVPVLDDDGYILYG
jgi:glutathione S-transferase